MTEKTVNRKLRAILSADAKGYSILMGEKEEEAVYALAAHRQIIVTLIGNYQGRVVHTPGDNVLAVFGSVFNAVRCAVQIQKELKTANSELPENQRMEFRIGINLGDIIEDAETIHGNGVNIAARIEGLADGGGICISESVYDNIKEKLSYGYEYLGERTVKNIKDPLKVYKILMEPEDAGKLIRKNNISGRLFKKAFIASIIAFALVATAAIWHFFLRSPYIESASIEKMAFTLPDKPSIAVLDFANMGEDSEQFYLSDGIAEEIITGLSKTDQLLVIARDSSFTYKGGTVKIKRIAEELGVRYVLQGSVRKSENRVRITAQLIDAIAGYQLWAERYDRDLEDIFAIQDDITMKIVTALQIHLTEGEQARMWSKNYKSIDIMLKHMEALSAWREGTEESHIRHGQLAREIIDMDPESSYGYLTLGWHYWHLAMIGKSPKESMAEAFKLAKKAISLDESDAYSHALLGNIFLAMRQYEKAISIGERAIALDPNGAILHVLLGLSLSYADRLDEAIGYIKKGIRLNPFPSYYYYVHLARCYCHQGQYEEALSEYKKALRLNPEAIITHIGLTAIYVLLDREQEARAAAKKVLELDRNFSVEIASKAWPYKNPANIKRLVDALKRAGLK
jgi:adenylate cyclase